MGHGEKEVDKYNSLQRIIKRELFIINKCQLSGRAVREPELRFSKSGKAICSFTLAIRRDFKNQDGDYESDFINCIAFGKTGELIAEWVKKGSLFPVWGKIQTRNYNDKEGVKRYVTEIIVEGFDFPPKQQGNGQAQQSQSSASSFGREVNLDNDTIPF